MKWQEIIDKYIHKDEDSKDDEDYHQNWTR
jgi:hypothetical protein